MLIAPTSQLCTSNFAGRSGATDPQDCGSEFSAVNCSLPMAVSSTKLTTSRGVPSQQNELMARCRNRGRHPPPLATTP